MPKDTQENPHVGLYKEIAENRKGIKENAKSLARIEGKLEGMAQQKKGDWQVFGIIGAICIGIWNMIK